MTLALMLLVALCFILCGIGLACSPQPPVRYLGFAVLVGALLVGVLALKVLS